MPVINKDDFSAFDEALKKAPSAKTSSDEFSAFDEELKKKEGGKPSKIGGQEQKVGGTSPTQSPSKLQLPEVKWEENPLNPIAAVKQAEEAKTPTLLPLSAKPSPKKVVPKKPATLEESVTKDKEEKGSRLEYIYNGILSGIGKLGSAASDVTMQILTKVLPDEAIGGTGTSAQNRESALKQWREQAEPEIRKSTESLAGFGISEKNREKYDNEFFTSSVRGLAESAPMMIGFKGSGLLLGGYDAGLQAINNTKLGNKLPEGTKTIFAFGVGTANAALEKIGIDKILGKQSKKVATNIAIKTIGDLVEKSSVPITTEIFEKALVANAGNIKNKILKAGGKISEAGVTEFLTGATQEGVNILAENILNKSQKQQIFDPTDFGQATNRIIYAGAQEAAGGGIMGAFSLPFSKTRNYINEKVSEAKSPEDIDNLKDEIVTQGLKQNISENEINEAINIIDQYVKIHSSIPENVTNKNKLAEKIIERNELNDKANEILNESQNLDPAFQDQKRQEAKLFTAKADEINDRISGNPIYKIDGLNVNREIFNNYLDSPAAKEGDVELYVEQDDEMSSKLEKLGGVTSIDDELDVPFTTNAKEFTEQKTKTNDTENITGLPSKVGVGEELITTEPIKGAGTETIGTGGVLQAPGVEGEGQGVEQKVGEVTAEEKDLADRRINEIGLQPLKSLSTSKEQYEKDLAAWEKNKKEVNVKFDAELKALKEKQQAELPQQKEVEKLRAEEQAEYDAMPNPNDKAKRKEIYDKYDKLITPLLKGGVGEAVPVGADIVNNVKEEHDILPISLVDKMRTQGKSRDTFYLENDIEKNGIKRPVELVYHVHDEKIGLSDGHNRLDALKEVGADNIPVVLKISGADAPSTAIEVNSKIDPLKVKKISDLDFTNLGFEGFPKAELPQQKGEGVGEVKAPEQKIKPEVGTKEEKGLSLESKAKENARTEKERATREVKINSEKVRYNGTDAIGSRTRTKSEQAASRNEAKAKIKSPETNASLKSANSYNESVGLPEVTPHKYKPSDPVQQTKLAKLYPKLEDVNSPTYKETDIERRIYSEYKSKHPEIFKQYDIKNYKDLVHKSYEQLIKETQLQYDALPVKVTFHEAGEGNYKNNFEMLDDVHNFNHLWVYKGGDDHTELGSKTIDKEGLTANDKFRAVHDYYGHSVEGYQFGKDGEENAWIEHSKMFSPLAQWALSSETRGQNSWVNYSGVNDAVLESIKTGSALLKEGERLDNQEMINEGGKLLSTVYDEFQFAQQKAIILPPEFSDVSKFHENKISEIPEQLKKGKEYENIQNKEDKRKTEIAKPGAVPEVNKERLEQSTRNASKREEAKTNLLKLRDEGILVTADKSVIAKAKKAMGMKVKPVPMTNAEINAQMSMLDAMSNVWKETTGQDNFYDTFIYDIKKGDLKAVKDKGGVLFQDESVPTRPISRVTLSVFEAPQFEKMKGQMVVPQSISDFIKGKGKQIEKDIINNVLAFDKYKGQKRISFDDFKNDVEIQVMKLEKIKSDSYAKYGMDNLGGGYGDAKTIIFNAPVDHGETGHFSGDFTTMGIDGKSWELRQIPNTEVWAAVDKDMPDNTPQAEIQKYVGTAGNKGEVEHWISQRDANSSTGNINKGLFGHIRAWFDKRNNVFHLAELQSDVYQKSKAADLFAESVPSAEVDEYMNREVWSKIGDEKSAAIIEERGYKVERTDGELKVLDKDGKVIAERSISETEPGYEEGQADEHTVISYALDNETNQTHNYDRIKSENFEEINRQIYKLESLLNKAKSNREFDSINKEIESLNKQLYKYVVFKNFGIRRSYELGEFNTSEEAKGYIDEMIKEKLKIKEFRDQLTDYFHDKVGGLLGKKQEYIDKRAKELKEAKGENMIEKQFIASQKVHEMRLFREAMKHAAEEGADVVRFPSPYTLAVIEGYVDHTGEGNAPYEIIRGDRDRLEQGDIIDYDGTALIVLDSDNVGITVAPKDEVSVFRVSDYIADEVNNRVSEIEYEARKHFEDLNNITKEEIESYEPDEWMGSFAKSLLEREIENVEEGETVKWKDIESQLDNDVTDDYNSRGYDDLFDWGGQVYSDGYDTVYVTESRRSTENFNQPDGYESESTEDDFEDNLSRDQQTVVDKYKEMGQMIRKTRPDAIDIRDDNNMGWIEIKITDADRNNPIIAFQNEGGKIKGAVDFMNDNKATFHIFDGADISTLSHEITGHLGRRFLEKLAETNEQFSKDYDAVKKWANVKDNQWTTRAEEKFARGFERYLREGKAPTKALESVFANLKNWLVNIYKNIKGSSIDVKLTQEVKDVFGRLLGGEVKAEKPKMEEKVIPEIPEQEAKIEVEVEPTVPPKPPISPEGKMQLGGEEIRGITVEENEKRRKDLGMPERQPNPETFEQWDNEAKKLLENGYNINNLIEKMEKGEATTPVENSIRKIFAATIDKELTENPSDEFLAQARRFTKASDVASSQAGKNLVSLKGNSEPLESITDFYMAKMDANGVDMLTEQQKKDVQEQFEKINKLNQEYQEKLKEAEAKNTELLAQNELIKQQKGKVKPKVPKQKKNFTEERQSLKEQLKKAVQDYKNNAQKLGISSDGGAENFAITVDMAKIITKIIKSHVEEVGAKLSEVTRKTLEDVKDLFDGITDKDIRDIIAGKYSEKKKTKSQLQADLNDIKLEAKLLDEYERVLKGEAKTEKEKIRKNQELTDLRKSIDELKKEKKAGQYSDEANARRMIEANKKKEEQVREKLANEDFEKEDKPKSLFENKEFKTNNPKLYKELLDSYTAKQDALHEYEVALLKDSQAKMSKGQKALDFSSKAINTTKKLVTGVDDSALFMQTLVAMMSRPAIGGKAFVSHIKDAASQKLYERNLAELHNSPMFPLMQKSGLDITEPKTLSEKTKEEAFAGESLDFNVTIKGKKYKVLSTLLEPFERAFTSLGNNMRAIAFTELAEKYINEGHTFENNPKLFKDLAAMLNTETGRGKQNEYIEKASKLVTAGIWSPRLMASRLNLLGVSDLLSPFIKGTKGYYRELSPEIRKQAIASVAKFASTVLVLSYGAAYMFGGELDDDPTSQGFMDIKIGDKKYNIAGGFSQYIRLIAQTIVGGKTTDGKFKELRGGDRGANLLHFLRGKLTPVSGVAADMLSGMKDYVGQPITITEEIKKLTIPLSMQGVATEMERDGMASILKSDLPAFVGIGVKDVRDFKQKEVFTKKEMESSKYKKVIESGLEMPGIGTRLSYSIKPDIKHPKGVMSVEEFKDFSELVIKYSHEETAKVISRYESKINHLRDLVKKESEDPAIEVEITKLKKELKSKLQSAHGDAIKKARQKLNLPSS